MLYKMEGGKMKYCFSIVSYKRNFFSLYNRTKDNEVKVKRDPSSMDLECHPSKLRGLHAKLW